MARRQGGFSDLMEFASRLPWKVSCAIGAVSFVVFHFTALATSSPPTAKTFSEFGSAVPHQLLHFFTYCFQLIVPAGFLIGATVSFVKGAQRRTLFAQVSAAPREMVSGLAWQDFERLVGEHFRRNGYQVVERGGSRPDGGVDLVITKSGQRYLVQCKHWRTQQVGVGVVRELNGVISAEGAAGGFIATGGQFTREAREFARKTPIELIDGEALEGLIGMVPDAAPDGRAETVAQPTPACPTCGGGMMQREATRGKFAGQAFWGCRRYPACKGIVPFV